MNDIETELPLTETTFFILLSLAPGRKHGYAIMQDVEDMSKGRISLSTGTLYGALKRLLANDWIVRVENDSAAERGRPRKEYLLTELGQRMLSAETTRMTALTQVASLRLRKDNL